MKVIPAYFVLGTIWNVVVFVVLTVGGNLHMPWYQGLMVGLLAGGAMTIVGETVIRAADRSMRREHGLIACISPSFWLRLLFTMVPGFIARAMAEAISTKSEPSPIDTDTFQHAEGDGEILDRRPRAGALSAGDSVVVAGETYAVMQVLGGLTGDRTVLVKEA